MNPQSGSVRVSSHSSSPRHSPSRRAPSPDKASDLIAPPKLRRGWLDTVTQVPVEVRGDDSETVSDGSSGASACGQDPTESSSRSDTLGVGTGAGLRPPQPKPDTGVHGIDIRHATAPHFASAVPMDIDASYDPLSASWPGAVSYAGSFMVGRAVQFALTATGNPMGSAMAFAAVAGTLHIGIEPIVGALREKMGMRADEDSAQFTQYVTSLANHVHGAITGDETMQTRARRTARDILASCGYDCKYDKTLPDTKQKPMPDTWEEAAAMLKAGARGFASNELPFYVFAVVYLLTNPAGLWVRSSLLSAGVDKDIATGMELLMSVAGGAMSGIGTVRVQNALRARIQATRHAGMRATIKLERLNAPGFECRRAGLLLLREALDQRLMLDDGHSDRMRPDVSEIQQQIEDAVYGSRVAPLHRDHHLGAIVAALSSLPAPDCRALLNTVDQELDNLQPPYTLGGAIAEKYQLMVASRDPDNPDSGLRADTGKIRRAVARTAANVGGLLAYGMAVVHTIQTIAQYGAAQARPEADLSWTNGTDPYPTTDAQAYGEVAALGPILITCWVGARALAPVIELGFAPITGLLSRAGGALKDCLAPTPVTNGPPQLQTSPGNILIV